MFGFGSIGGWELVFLVVLVLMLFGPRRIPQIARTFGKTVAQLRRASHDFRTGIEREVEAERLTEAGDALRALRQEVGSIGREATDAVRAAPGSAGPPDRPSKGKGPTGAGPVPTERAPEETEENARRDERTGDS